MATAKQTKKKPTKPTSARVSGRALDPLVAQFRGADEATTEVGVRGLLVHGLRVLPVLAGVLGRLRNDPRPRMRIVDALGALARSDPGMRREALAALQVAGHVEHDPLVTMAIFLWVDRLDPTFEDRD